MKSDDKNDTLLMVELQAGRDGALSDLIARWQRPLLSFTYRYTQNQADSADVVQETFVRVYQSRDRYRPQGRVSTWLFTIAANLCRNCARWRKRHPTIPLDFAVSDASGVESCTERDWLEDERAERPGASLVEQEKVEAVKSAISDLPHDLKTALLLFQYEELSYQEIAEVVGCSVKAVETRLYRARHQLKKRLAGLDREELPAVRAASPTRGD
jgi:RNA polymerase sigma-70 factor (ECF subfamily)